MLAADQDVGVEARQGASRGPRGARAARQAPRCCPSWGNVIITENVLWPPSSSRTLLPLMMLERRTDLPMAADAAGAGGAAGAADAVGAAAAGVGSRSRSCSSARRRLSASTPLLKLPCAVNLQRKSSGGPHWNR